MEQANFAELREKINSWDIQAEEVLIQKIKIFTLKYNEEFQSLCKNFDNFSNSISSTEVEHLNAINQLKSLSTERFIEQSLESCEPIQQENPQEEKILMNETEKMKYSIDLSMQFMEKISKKNKKEVIEDDASSVHSSKMTMEKNTKGVKLPYIIGTEVFNADKAIGLDVPPEEEEKEEEDVNELVKVIQVDAKQQAKWDKIEEKRKKKREKELKKKQKAQPQKPQIEEEPEVKVPIENEEEQKHENISNQNSSDIKIVAHTGGTVPPPPPPPPLPPLITAPIKPPVKATQPKPKVENPPPFQVAQPQIPTNPPVIENPEQNNAVIEQPKPQPEIQKPVDFQTELRNRMITKANNKNPLAPVIRDEKIVITKQNVKLNNFIAGRLDDDEDEEDFGDIKKCLFRKNPPLISPNINLMNQPQPVQNGIESQKANFFSDGVKPEEQNKNEIQNEQQENNFVSPQNKILAESQVIQIKQNRNLDNARKKMKNLFGSDDEDDEEDNPTSIVDKTKELSNKLKNFGISSNPQNEPKKEEPKSLPKKAFFDDDDDDEISNIKIEKNDLPKQQENKIENMNNNSNQNQPPKKPKLAFFDDDDNEKEKIKANKPEIKPNNPPSYFENLKGKIDQRNDELNKKEQQNKEEIKKEEPKKLEIKVEKPDTQKRLSMKPNENISLNMNKRFSDMKIMLENKIGHTMVIGHPKLPKPEEEKIEHNAPADDGEPTYEKVIRSATAKNFNKRKPKRSGVFGVDEAKIEVPQKPQKVENETKDVNEKKDNEELKKEEIKEESKKEEIIEQPKIEENKPELNEQSPPNPPVEQETAPSIKNSVFNLFAEKEEEPPKKQNLFDFVSNPSQNNDNTQKPKVNLNLNFLNNGEGEVKKSKLFFLEDDDDDKPSENINKNTNENINKNTNENIINIKKVETNKKKLAFFDDDN